MSDFGQVIRENYLFIYNYALRLICHPQDAEDLTQQTFLAAYEKREQLREEQALQKWLMTICYRNFLMLLRARGVREETSAEMEEIEKEGNALSIAVPGPEEEVIVADEIRALQNGCFMAMVRRLTLKQRIAFSLVDMFGMNSEDAAQLLEVTPGALKGLLFRARMNLDSFFDEHCNLLQSENPCSCAAWIHFRENHEENKKQMEKTIRNLDYREKNYRFDDKTRAKVNYLYQHMPQQRPSDEWFEGVIEIFKEKNYL